MLVAAFQVSFLAPSYSCRVSCRKCGVFRVCISNITVTGLAVYLHLLAIIYIRETQPYGRTDRLTVIHTHTHTHTHKQSGAQAT